MTFYKVNFALATNEDLRQMFVLSDSSGQALNLANASWRMSLEPSTGSEDVLVLSSNTTGITIVEAEAGAFELAAPASTIGTLAPGVYYHDLLLSLDGRELRIWEGTLHLEKGIS